MLGQVSMGDLYNHDEDFLIMKQSISEDFIDTHRLAFEAYVNGDWQLAKEQFESAIEYKCAID